MTGFLERFIGDDVLARLGARFRIALPVDHDASTRLHRQTYLPPLVSIVSAVPGIAFGIAILEMTEVNNLTIATAIVWLVCFGAFAVTFKIVDMRSGRVASLPRHRGGLLYYASPWRLIVAAVAVVLAALPFVIAFSSGLLRDQSPELAWRVNDVIQLTLMVALVPIAVTLALWFSIDGGITNEADRPNWLDVQRKSGLSWWLGTAVMMQGVGATSSWYALGDLMVHADPSNDPFELIQWTSSFCWIAFYIGGMLIYILPSAPSRRSIRRAAAASAADDSATMTP